MYLKPELSFGFEKTRERFFHIIDGDNADALKLLAKDFSKRIRFVYIDPPYNTGRLQYRSFNDRFWDFYSRERHQKWLDFMEERLLLLKPLLTDDARVFISIDDAELPNLLLLLRKLFGKDNTDVMIWDKIPRGGTAGQGKMKRVKRFRVEHEFILAAYLDKQKIRFNKIRRLISTQKKYGNPDNDPRGPWISAELCKSAVKSLPTGKNYYTIITPSGRKISRQWHVSREEFERLDEEGRIWWGNGRIIPRLKKFVNEPYPVTPGSVIRNISQTEGVKDLEKYVENAGFYHPKPIRLIKYLLELAADTDDIVLDFFAGTGSTGHALMEFNREKGKDLSCILISNNENNSLYEILLPRLKKVSHDFQVGPWQLFSVAK